MNLVTYVALSLATLVLAVALYLILANLRQQTRDSQAPFQVNIIWYASQIETELLVLIDSLGSYYAANESVTHDDVVDRFDIFWSRVEATENGSNGELFMSYQGARETIQRAKDTLVLVEPDVMSLEPGDRVAYLKIKDQLRVLQPLFHKVTLESSHLQNQMYTQQVRSVDDTRFTITLIFGGVLAGGSLLVILILFERRKVIKLQNSLERRVEERTEQLQREIAERNRAEERLRESEEHFRGVVENSPSAIYLKDLEGRYQLVNRKFEEWFGVTAADVLGKTSHHIFSKEYADADVAQDREALQSSSVVEEERDVPLPDGTMHRVVSNRFPVFDADARHAGVGIIATDVTDHRHAEEQLRQSQRMEAIGQLTGGIAHDFNNLLAIVMGHAELLQDAVVEDENMKRSVETIIRSADRGSSLTGRLLTFSRQSMLSPAVAQVSELIGSLSDMLQSALGETIDLKVEITPELWLATIDAHQLEDALINLAINARDAMPQGGILTIETANVTLEKTFAQQYEETAPGDYVQISVSDTGCGIPPEVLGKVFEPFFTTKGVGEGSGLGLSMFYGFAKQSKGHITIYSEVGQGTTVNLYVPRSEEDQVKTGAKHGTQEIARRSERILVVEDDEHLRAIPVSTLRDQGYDIVESGDGKEAIKHLKDGQSFALLFTDVVLPGGMNGIEVAEKAKQIHPNIKVFFTTGYAENAVIHHGMLDPGATVLNKPYRRAELLEQVRAILDSRDS